MKSLRKAYGWIAAFLVLILVGGMILTTVLLAKSEEKEWTYYYADDTFDYYAQDASGNDFQYVNNFKSAVKSYFSSLIHDDLKKIIDVEGLLEKYLNGVAERAVSAMEAARVSAAKLNKIAEFLKDNSLSNAYTIIKEYVSKFDSFDDMEADIYENVGNYTIFSLFRNILSDLMYETGITENEIASFIYHFLLQNSNPKYVSYMTLIGEKFFTELISDTIYVIVTFGDFGGNDFITESTAYTARSILYQLGSMYVGISSIPGGAETLEHVLWTNEEYDESFADYERLNALSEKTKGKLGEFFVLVGYFMKEIDADDIYSYFSYTAEKDEGLKNDDKIYSALRFSKRFDDVLKARFSIEENRMDSFVEKYDEMLDALCETSLLLTKEAMNGEEEASMLPSTEFSVFGNACKALSNQSYSLEEIQQMDKESEEYKLLSEQSNDFYQAKVAVSSTISYVIMIWIASEVNTYIKTGLNAYAEKEE